VLGSTFNCVVKDYSDDEDDKSSNLVDEIE
jgi:hypothetical protein